MSRLEEFLAIVLVAIGIAVGGWFALEHYGTKHYDAGYAAAVEAGVKLRQAETERNREVEFELRAQRDAAEANAFKKEQEYASNLANAQRRVLTGADRLRCPAASPVPASAAPGDRPTAGAPAADGAGPDLVPEAAADVLGHGAAVAGLVRRYAEVLSDFESCRAVNAKP